MDNEARTVSSNIYCGGPRCSHTDFELQVDHSYNGCTLCDNERLRDALTEIGDLFVKNRDNDWRAACVKQAQVANDALKGKRKAVETRPQADVWAQLREDVEDYGTAFARRLADGTVERVSPDEAYIRFCVCARRDGRIVETSLTCDLHAAQSSEKASAPATGGNCPTGDYPHKFATETTERMTKGECIYCGQEENGTVKP